MRYTDYLPACLSGLAEYIAIGAAVQPELDALDVTKTLLPKGFIQTAGERTIERLEWIDGAIVNADLSLDARRQRLMDQHDIARPYNIARLLTTLGMLMGDGNAQAAVDCPHYTLTVKFAAGGHYTGADKDEAVRRVTAMLPANMKLVTGSF